MDRWKAVRGTGLLFLALVLGTIALLVVGFGIAGWFTTSRAEVGVGAFGMPVRAEVSVGLRQVELCADSLCATRSTFEASDSGFILTALLAMALGAGFGVLVLWIANKRLAGAAIPVWIRRAGLAAGAVVIAVAALTMTVLAPGELSYLIGVDAEDVIEQGAVVTVVVRPALGLGGVYAIAGVLLGGVVIWGARTAAPVELPVEAPRRRAPRTEPTPLVRGPETDPFRAPPQPPPLAVIRHERPATTPVAADPSSDQPELLR